MMRFLVTSALFMLISVATAARAEQGKTGPSAAARHYLEQVLDLMQKNALHKQEIDWARVRKEALTRAENATNTYDTYPAIAYALTQLKETHSFLEIPDRLGGVQRQTVEAEITRVLSGRQLDRKPSPFSPSKQMQGHLDEFEGKKFAYVTVPMCIPTYSEWERNGPVFQEFADQLHSIIADLDGQKPAGWIIDLRGNGGGNMWPMLAGIGALIGEGDLGSFISADRDRQPWFYKGGKVGRRPPDGAEEIDAFISKEPIVLSPLPPVAVLFDRGTASSGESVAIAFAGRPRARSFGEHTAGFSTSNNMHPLSDGASLFLCEGLEADRTERLYPDGLDPDVAIAEPSTRPADNTDAALQAAEEWLSHENAK
jgi:hypothetical protein